MAPPDAPAGQHAVVVCGTSECLSLRHRARPTSAGRSQVVHQYSNCPSTPSLGNCRAWRCRSSPWCQARAPDRPRHGLLTAQSASMVSELLLVVIERAAGWCACWQTLGNSESNEALSEHSGSVPGGRIKLGRDTEWGRESCGGRSCAVQKIFHAVCILVCTTVSLWRCAPKSQVSPREVARCLCLAAQRARTHGPHTQITCPCWGSPRIMGSLTCPVHRRTLWLPTALRLASACPWRALGRNPSCVGC